MKVDLEKEYQEYLKLVGLKESEMHPVQAIETKRAFYGGCGRLFNLMDVVSNSTESEEEAIDGMQEMKDQITNFWKKETEKHGVKD